MQASPDPLATGNASPRWSLLRGLSAGQAGFFAGIVAGIVYLPGRMLFAVLLTPHDSLAPLSRIAALLLGPDVLPPEPANFVVVSMALLLHFGLSILYAQLIGQLVDGCGAGQALWRGAAFGLALFVVNFLGLAPRLFPWFAEGAHAGTAVSHVVFGIVAAACFTLLRRPADAVAPPR